GFLMAPPTDESQGLAPFFGTATRSALPPCALASSTRLALAPPTSGAEGSLTICRVMSSCAAVAAGAAISNAAPISFQLAMSVSPVELAGSSKSHAGCAINSADFIDAVGNLAAGRRPHLGLLGEGCADLLACLSRADVVGGDRELHRVDEAEGMVQHQPFDL